MTLHTTTTIQLSQVWVNPSVGVCLLVVQLRSRLWLCVLGHGQLSGVARAVFPVREFVCLFGCVVPLVSSPSQTPIHPTAAAVRGRGFVHKVQSNITSPVLRCR